MKYLIKDLSKMTGLSPARIRKWQERYNILRPTQAHNGYYYYDNDDLRVLLFIKNQLSNGKTLKELLNISREQVLNKNLYLHEFTQKELELINYISNYQYHEIQKHLDSIYKKSFLKWISEIRNLLILVGRAWEKNFLSVADEHSISNWIRSYIAKHLLKEMKFEKPVWLVCVFPGDTHELGAMLHFAKLLYYKVPAKFVGMLPKHELLREIRQNSYRKISISVVLPKKWKELENLRKEIQKISNAKVLFGGYGFKQTQKPKKTIKNIRT
ncbi:MAG: MerR family transcriptional regulator [Leptospiraceae bacterium]|nr:MerR family transcriptional regulator [Leptospiraceae bacterium]MDW7975700.1 MerR family transcriptional regulator [Leptospiraceae bacterium]